MLNLFAWVFCILVAVLGIGSIMTSVPSGLLIFAAAALICPPIWARLKDRTGFAYRKSAVTALLVAGVGVGTYQFNNTPEGRAAAAKRDAEALAKFDKENEERRAEEAAEKRKADAESRKQAEAQAQELAAEDAKKASGEHCFSSWDGSVYALKEGVKQAMRNPDSFDHASTTYSRKGKLLEVRMTYRGQNGFGGMNIEQIKATMEPRTCQIVSVSESQSL